MPTGIRGLWFIAASLTLTVFGRGDGSYLFELSVEIRAVIEATLCGDIKDGKVRGLKQLLRHGDPAGDDIVPGGEAVDRFEYLGKIGRTHIGDLRYLLKAQRVRKVLIDVGHGVLDAFDVGFTEFRLAVQLFDHFRIIGPDVQGDDRDQMEDDHSLVTRPLLFEFADDLSGERIDLFRGVAVCRNSVDEGQILRGEDVHILRAQDIGVEMLDEFGHEIEAEAGGRTAVGVGCSFGDIMPLVASEEVDVMGLDGVVFSSVIICTAAALHDLDLELRMEVLNERAVVLGRIGIVEPDAGFSLSLYGQDDLSVIHFDRSPFWLDSNDSISYTRIKVHIKIL